MATEDRARIAAALRSLRTPWLTLAVLAVTAVVSIVGLAHEPVLEALERRSGEPGWWRLATSLLVHGGAIELAANLLLLAVVGTAAEQQRSRPQWALGYLVGGLVGEVAGRRWEPTGAGNSVAVLGVLGGVAVVAWLRRDVSLPALGVGAGLPALAWGCATLAALLAATFDDGAASLAVWVVVAVGAGTTVQVVGRRGAEDAARFLAVGTVLLGATLVLRGDIHGPALLAGVAVGTVTEPWRQRPRTPVDR